MNRTGPAALTLGALLLLASCSGQDADAGPKPTATSSSPSATTASPTPSETPPPMPAQAREDSIEGTAALVAHYFEVLSYAGRTQDIGPLAQLSDPKCTGCNEYINLFTRSRVSGLDWSTKDVQVVSNAKAYGTRAKVDVIEDSGPKVYDLYLEVGRPSRKVVVMEPAE
jgi:hypothetical protein